MLCVVCGVVWCVEHFSSVQRRTCRREHYCPTLAGTAVTGFSSCSDRLVVAAGQDSVGVVCNLSVNPNNLTVVLQCCVLCDVVLCDVVL